MITYDIVSNPSHARARVLEFLPESYDAGSNDDSTLICESSDSDVLFLQQDGINILNESLEKSFIESIIKNDFERAIKDLKFRF